MDSFDGGGFGWSFVGAVSEEIAEDEERVFGNDPLYDTYDTEEREWVTSSEYGSGEESYNDAVEYLEETQEENRLDNIEQQLANIDLRNDGPDFISLKEVQDITNNEVKTTLRPFERFIQDLISGKKTLDDGLY